MRYLEITGLPINEEMSSGYINPVAFLAQQIYNPSEYIELRLFIEKGTLHCYLVVEDDLFEIAISELVRTGYSVQSVSSKVEKKTTEYVLTRELLSKTEIIPYSSPKFSYEVSFVDNSSFKSNSLYEYLSNCVDGSGFSIIIGAGRPIDTAFFNRLTNCNHETGGVIERIINSPKLFPAVVFSFSSNAVQAESIAKKLSFVYTGLIYRKIAPQYGDSRLFLIENDNPKVRMIGKLHAMYTSDEINALADLNGTRCDYGLKYNTDSIIKNRTTEGKPLPELHIGKDGQNNWVGIPFKTVSRHMFIGGAAGTGKGNLLACLAFQFSEAGIPFLMIESSKAELHHLRKAIDDLNVWRPINGEYVLNPFALPDDVSLDEYQASLNNMMRLCFNLEGSLEELVSEALRNCFSKNGFSGSSKNSDNGITPFGINEVMTEYRQLLERKPYSARIKADMKTAGLTRLQSLFTENKAVFDSIRSIPTSQLISGHNLLQLNSLPTQESKQMFATLLLSSLSAWLKLRMRNESNKDLQLVIIMDESHNLLKSATNGRGQTFPFANDFEALLLEMRSLGIGFIIADQSSTNLPSGMVDACATKVFLGGDPYSGIEGYAEKMGLDKVSLNNLFRLGTGEGLLYSSGMPVASTFKTPHILSLFNVNEDYPIKNSFLYNNPRFTIETYQECAKCPQRGKCTIEIKTKANSISEALFSDYGHLLGLVDQEKDVNKRKTIKNDFVKSIAIDTASYNDLLFCCIITQLSRICKRQYNTPMDPNKVIKVIRGWREKNGY